MHAFGKVHPAIEDTVFTHPSALHPPAFLALNFPARTYSRVMILTRLSSFISPGCLLHRVFYTPPKSALRWDPSEGAVFGGAKSWVRFGGNAPANSLLLRFPTAKTTQSLRNPHLKTPTPAELILTYDTQTPEGIPIRIERHLRQTSDREGLALRETFTLTPAQPLTNDLEIEIPFAAQIGARPSASPSAGDVWPDAHLPS